MTEKWDIQSKPIDIVLECFKGKTCNNTGTTNGNLLDLEHCKREVSIKLATLSSFTCLLCHHLHPLLENRVAPIARSPRMSTRGPAWLLPFCIVVQFLNKVLSFSFVVCKNPSNPSTFEHALQAWNANH